MQLWYHKYENYTLSSYLGLVSYVFIRKITNKFPGADIFGVQFWVLFRNSNFYENWQFSCPNYVIIIIYICVGLVSYENRGHELSKTPKLLINMTIQMK